MSTEKRILEYQSERINLSSDKEKVELGLIDDVEKILDNANSKRRRLESLGKKLSNDFNELTSDYARAFQLSKQAENKAKELGADDLVKLFGNRGDEAKDYQNIVGKVSNKIESAINSI